MEKLAKQTAKTISEALNYDEDKQAVIAYGLTALFQMITIAVAISVIGILANFWFEAMILFVGVGLLRKSTGGAHAKTMLGCTIISIFSICAMSALCRYVLINIAPLHILLPIFIILSGCCFFIAYRKVPIDSPNKPINRPEKITRLRKQSFITIFLYIVISIALLIASCYNIRMVSISSSFICALIWQTLTLTRLGSAFISALDMPFNKFK